VRASLFFLPMEDPELSQISRLLDEIHQGVCVYNEIFIGRLSSAILTAYTHYKSVFPSTLPVEPIVAFSLDQQRLIPENFFTAGFLNSLYLGRVKEFCIAWDGGSEFHFERGDSLGWNSETKFLLYRPVVPMDHIKVNFVILPSD
jgi:hypothetical protein